MSTNRKLFGFNQKKFATRTLIVVLIVKLQSQFSKAAVERVQMCVCVCVCVWPAVFVCLYVQKLISLHCLEVDRVRLF